MVCHKKGGPVMEKIILAIMIILAVIVNLEERPEKREKDENNRKRLWD